ncbi:50S ribosomal protein L10 [Brockia lithotrophica]|uniref:Large ribosomal subunit protein uL10 n=1 Tax=Brockia lithotrophica TaxID=933949 RepID=A0A660KW52_9BACL|nr:50S ribosomal protein L10 [Brockia lithotrophica]RKQ85581.1 LSU ribosomal protein L10P [Brockia lithotrophica]
MAHWVVKGAERPEKVALVEEIREKIGRSQGVYLVEYRGIPVATLSGFRRRVREAGGELVVYKNTLFRLAAAAAGIRGLEGYLTGPTIFAFAYGDAAAMAKLLFELTKEHEGFQVKAGWVEGRVYDRDGVDAIAKLPPREVLLAQLVGGIQAPITRFVGTLQSLTHTPLRNLRYGLEEVAKLKAQAS